MNNQEAIDLLDNLIGMISDNQDSDYDEALKLGIKALSESKCFDGMTNGEVIKALFPNYDYEDKTEYFGRIRNLDDHFIKADIDFWNSPYQKRW